MTTISHCLYQLATSTTQRKPLTREMFNLTPWPTAGTPSISSSGAAAASAARRRQLGNVHAGEAAAVTPNSQRVVADGRSPPGGEGSSDAASDADIEPGARVVKQALASGSASATAASGGE